MYKVYGARVHFDENQIASAILDCDTGEFVLRGEPEWEEAKMQAKVSATTLCTIREHLTQTHLIVSNSASREVPKNLHPEHPIRRLLAIFTYNAVSINQQASNLLVPDRCIIHRASPLTFEGLQQTFDNAFTDSIAYQPFPDRDIKNSAVAELEKNGGFPYVTEGIEYYEIARGMVREWLTNAGEEASDQYALDFYEAMKKTSEGQAYVLPEYSEENMVDLISSVIFAVTAFHEIVGSIGDCFGAPNKNGFRISRKDPLQVDAQSYMLLACIVASTSLPAPKLMKKFEFYIGIDAPGWETEVWTSFQKKLAVQSNVVRKRDDERAFEFKYFEPSNFDCSVSV